MFKRACVFFLGLLSVIFVLFKSGRIGRPTARRLS